MHLTRLTRPSLVVAAVSLFGCADQPSEPDPDDLMLPMPPSVAAGRTHACVSTDQVHCWGSNDYSQLGPAPTTAMCVVDNATVPCSLLPQPLGADVALSHLTAGDRHTCGLTVEGRAYCWGWNAFGQLGDGTTTNRATVAPVAGDHRFVVLSAGTVHTCGLTAAGEAYCWGAARSGVVNDTAANGLGAPVSEVCQNPTPSYRGAEWPCSATPLAVGGGLHFRSINAGIWGTCGVTADGIAYCWGWNQTWGLGTGTDQHRSTPTAVATAQAFTDVYLGTGHGCARTETGAAYCWGARIFDWGQLGNGEVNAGGDSTPALVVGGHAWSTLALPDGNHIYSGFTCGVTTAEAVYCWGSNRDRQLAVESAEQVCASAEGFTCSGTPVLVAVPPAQAVATGSGFACALAKEGTLYCWGANNGGQLGDGTTEGRAEPRAVAVP